jgi:hypothetical protein
MIRYFATTNLKIAGRTISAGEEVDVSGWKYDSVRRMLDQGKLAVDAATFDAEHDFYTVTEDDFSEGHSYPGVAEWFGGYDMVVVFEWTPTRTGIIDWIAPVPDMDREVVEWPWGELYLFDKEEWDAWVADPENVEYPYSTYGAYDVDDGEIFSYYVGRELVEAGKTYIFAYLLPDPGYLGATIDFGELWSWVQVVGGVEKTYPPPPHGFVTQIDGRWVGVPSQRSVLAFSGSGMWRGLPVHGSVALGMGSHAEGSTTFAEGPGSHAEGGSSRALGMFSHAEGQGSLARWFASHASSSGEWGQGTAQYERVVLTGSDTHQMRTGWQYPILPENFVATYQAMVVRRSQDGTLVKAWRLEGVVNTIGTPGFIGTPTKTVVGEKGAVSGWDLTVAFGTDRTLAITPVGTSANSKTVATVEFTEVG